MDAVLEITVNFMKVSKKHGASLIGKAINKKKKKSVVLVANPCLVSVSQARPSTKPRLDVCLPSFLSIGPVVWPSFPDAFRQRHSASSHPQGSPSHPNSRNRSKVTLYLTRRSASALDGESGQWGAEFPHGEAERRELFHQVVRCGGSIRGALILWRPILQLLLYWDHDWWVFGSAPGCCSATVSVSFQWWCCCLLLHGI